MALPWLLLAACTGGNPGDSGVDTDSSGTTPAVDGVAFGAVQTCDDPLDAVAYEEVGGAMGLEGGPDPDGDHAEGGSVAVWDVDADGDLDVIVAFLDEPLTLYRRDGAQFSRESLATGSFPWLLGATDADGDGLLDLLVGGTEPELHLGTGQAQPFTTGSLPALPLDPYGLNSVAKVLAPGDYDGDGLMDIYAVVNAGGTDPEGEALADFVLWGEGGGSFEADATAVPAAGQRRGFDAAILEWQGGPAIYVANDMGPEFGEDVLMDVDGDRTFVDRTTECTCNMAHSAMGMDVGDWNGDGLADVYVAATPYNVLHTAQPDGSFVDMSAAVGAEGLLERWGMAWGAAFLDYDNDGQVDILDAQGDQWWVGQTEGTVLPQPIWMLRQDGGTFTNVGTELGLAEAGSFRSVVAADHNGDGVLDLLVTDVVDTPHLYLSTGCTAAAWLAVAAPIDSRVEVEADGTTHVDWAHTHSGYGGAHAPVVHVGLGSATQVDRLTVTEPDGTVHTVSDPFEPRRLVVVGTAPGVVTP